MPISNWSTVAADNDDSDLASGINLAEGQSPGSLNDSMRSMMAVLAGANASDTAKGFVELATAAEALAGTDATRAVTPAALATNKVLAASGFYKFPGGLVVQWGQVDITLNASGDQVLSFPTPFSTAVYTVIASTGYAAVSGTEICGVRNPTDTSVTSTVFSFRPNPGAVTRRVNWVAFGL